MNGREFMIRGRDIEVWDSNLGSWILLPNQEDGDEVIVTWRLQVASPLLVDVINPMLEDWHPT